MESALPTLYNGFYESGIHSLDVPASFDLNRLTFIDSSPVKKGDRDTVSFDWKLVSNRRWLSINASVVADSGHIEKPEADVAFTVKDSLLGFAWAGGYKDTLRPKGKYLIEPGSKRIRKISAIYMDKPIAIDVKSNLANVRYRTTIVYRDTLP